jgi:urea transport system ATP-binding protein
MIRISNLNSYYGRSHILHEVSLEVSTGTIVTVIGRNGVGKTTLLKTIMGLTDRATGSIMLDGRELIGAPTFERARAGIAYVPQGREIIPDFTVEENILMGGFACDGKRAIPEMVAELFPYLTDNLDRPGGLLSGGQQQQLAIARGLAARPKVLLLDEPTEGIQPNLVPQIERTISVLNEQFGISILLIEQNVEFARKASHHMVILEKGEVVASMPASEMTEEITSKYVAI